MILKCPFFDVFAKTSFYPAAGHGSPLRIVHVILQNYITSKNQKSVTMIEPSIPCQEAEVQTIGTSLSSVCYCRLVAIIGKLQHIIRPEKSSLESQLSLSLLNYPDSFMNFPEVAILHLIVNEWSLKHSTLGT